MKKKKKKMFDELVQKPALTKKWLLFPISLLLHGLVIAAVIVFPLLSAADDMPKMKVMDVFLMAPPPPSVPTPPAAAKGGGKKGSKKPGKREAKPRPINDGRIVAPVEIPDEIEDEDLGMLGLPDGIPGGVEGGVPGGVENGVLGAALLGEGDQEFRQEMRISQVQMPRLMKEVRPIYPKVALKAHIQGNVVIEAATDIYGRVIRARVIAGSPLLKQAAIDAVKQWRYEPYIINGIPKPVIFTVTVIFRLQGR
jgi:protein TonB